MTATSLHRLARGCRSTVTDASRASDIQHIEKYALEFLGGHSPLSIAPQPFHRTSKSRIRVQGQRLRAHSVRRPALNDSLPRCLRATASPMFTYSRKPEKKEGAPRERGGWMVVVAVRDTRVNFTRRPRRVASQQALIDFACGSRHGLSTDTRSRIFM